MIYRKYKDKIDKRMKVLAVLIKFRWLIIGVAAFCVALASVFFGVKGVVIENTVVADTVFAYGELPEYSAKALFSTARYEYRQVGGEWSEEMPVKVGNYEVRVVSRRSFGKIDYGTPMNFSIQPQKVKIRLKTDSVVYGEKPEIVADLAYADKIEDFAFGYGEIKDEATASPVNYRATATTLSDESSSFAGATELSINVDSFVVKSESDENVSDQYEFVFDKTEVSLIKRQISFSSLSNEFVYDDTEKTYDEYEITDGSLAFSDSVSIRFSCAINDVGVAANTFEVSIYSADGDNVTDLYDVNKTYGKLSVVGRELSVMGKDSEFTYDGAAHTYTEVAVDENTSLADGHELRIASLTDAVETGEYENKITASVFDADGTDVTFCYTLNVTFGKITINKRAVTVTSAGNGFVYDGKAHYEESCTADNLVAGHSLRVVSRTEITEVSEKDKKNELNVKVYDGENDKTENYEITYVCGTLTVTPRTIKVTTKDCEFIYNGMAQYCEEYEVENLVEWHSLRVVSRTEITEVREGNKKNELTVKVYDGENDKTENYEITYVCGTLTVTPRTIKVTTKSREFIYNGTAQYCEEYEVENLVAGHSLRVVSHTEITEVREKDKKNELTVKVYDGESDKTENYEITYEYGTLKVIPRPINVTTASNSFVYDGKEHYEESCTADDLVAGHSLVVALRTEITEVREGNKKNELTVKVYDGESDKTENYEITYIYGILTVLPRPITVGTGNSEKVYDGKSLTDDRYFEIPNEGECGLVGGHKLSVSVIGTRTDAGDSDNIVDEENTIITDKNGKIVTENYAINYIYGTLTITPRPITVTTASNSFVYDGKAHHEESCTAENLVEGHSLRVVSRTEITEVSEKDKKNELNVKVYEGENDKTENYEITYVCGTLTVTPRTIKVTTKDCEFIYNGMAQHCEEYEVENLIEWHSLRVDSYTEITEVRESGKENKLIVKVYDGESDKTDNYEITYEYGTLKVTPRPITVTTKDCEFIYNGTAQYCEEYEVKDLVEWHSLRVVSNTGITEVRESGKENKLIVKVYDGESDKTENYEITYIYGILTVLPRPITVGTGDSEKVYDGKSLTDDRYFEIPNEGECGLVGGHKLSVRVIGTRTDAGKSDNIVDEEKTVITDKNGKIVTENYKIEYACGILKVIPRPITITTGGAEKVYDNKPLSNDFYEITSQLSPVIVAGQHAVVSFWYESGLIDVCDEENGVNVAIIDLSGKDQTANYDVTYSFGRLKITPRIVMYSSESAEKVYDGTPLTAPCVYDADAILSEHNAEVTFTSILVGKSFNEAKPDIITDEYGRNVTFNYKFVAGEIGVLTVLRRELIVTTGSAEKKYDGKPLICEEYTVDGLIGGDEVESAKFRSYTDVGVYNNEASFKIKNKDGIDVSDGYKVVYSKCGVITIKEIATIIVATSSASKVYDGRPLTCNDWSIIDIIGLESIPDNIDVIMSITGSITNVGETENVATGRIVDETVGGEAKGYILSIEFGMLTVVEKKTTNYGGSLDDSGDLGGEKRNSDDTEKTIAFELVGDTNGEIYLRYKSFGDYTGRGWANANEYDGRIEGEYSYNYLNGVVLEKFGYKANTVKIKSYADYMLPYYLALGGNGYTVQPGDVTYSGDCSEQYVVRYFAFDFNKDYSMVQKIVSNKYFDDSSYYRFVYENYLSVPDDTKTYLQNIIDKNGWGKSYSDLVRIAEYVQNAAKYNLEYNSRMDYEKDVVVAFLDKYKEGVCRHYASAATLIYRTLGIPARYVVGYAGSVKNGEQTQITAPGHAWVEIYVEGFGWVKMEVTGGGPGGGSGEGSGGEQEKEIIKIRPVDVDKAYDGTPLYAKNEVTGDDKFNELLKKGYRYTVEVEGERTDLGESVSRILHFELYDRNGKIVTNEFEVVMSEGKVTITNNQILVCLHEKKKTYDGTPLTYNEGEYWIEGLPQGYRLDVTLGGEITCAGELSGDKIKEKSSYTLYDENGNDVTDEFYVKFIGGLTVVKATITVTSASDEKEYDGEPLEAPEAWANLNKLAKGDEIVVVKYASLTDVGTVQNEVEIKIINSRGEDVTNNYVINYLYGTLCVYEG